MKKGDFLAFSFFKKSRWMSAAMALIFLLNVCAPAWAREGNHGSSTALKSFASGSLVGVFTAVSCISPVAGVIGSLAGDITGFAMYYYSYESYGKTWIKIGKMEISKGQICSMIAGIVATAGANLLTGAIEGVIEEAAEGAAEEAAEGGVVSAIETTAENGATSAATSTATSAAASVATSAAPGLLSSVVSAAIQLPVNIIKVIIQFVKDFIEKGLKAALENLLKHLWDAIAKFAVTIKDGFLETFKDIFSRKTSITANPYFQYGQEGAIDKALVRLGGDLGVGMVRLIVTEYVKQNLQEGITIGGKKILGPLDETIAGMIGSMVSNYVGASAEVMIMRSLGDICGWNVGAQGNFLDRGRADPNTEVKINNNSKDDATVSEVYNSAGGTIDPAKSYSFIRSKGNKVVGAGKDKKVVEVFETIQVTGQQLLNSNPNLKTQLQNYGEALGLVKEMTKSGAEPAAMGDTNGESSKIISVDKLKNYGLRIGNGNKLVSDKAVDGKLVVKMDNGESMVIDLNKSSAENTGQFKLVITNQQLEITAQELSNSGVTGNQTGNFKVRRNDNSIVDVTVNNENAGSIKAAVGKYNKAMDSCMQQAFGQYGILAMGDPNKFIGVEAIGVENGEKRLLTIGELALQPELAKHVMENQGVSRAYKLKLGDKEFYILSESLTGQVTGQLRAYHVIQNSASYKQLFNMTGGLMYNLNGKDMNTQGILRSGFEAVRNMGLAPIVSTVTRIALLKVMDYHTHYSNDKGRIYENMWKMALANAGANIVTDAFNNLDSVQEAIYGLDRGQNLFATKGSNSFGLHIAARALEEAGGALSQIAWGAYLKKNNLNSDAMNEMGHLLGTSLVAGSIDALFRQKPNQSAETKEGKMLLGKLEVAMPNQRLSWDNLGDSSVRFTKGVLGDFKNQFIEAALDSALLPFPLRSPGTGPNAFMNQWTVQDKFTHQISSIAQGVSPIDADLMRISSNLSYRADTNFAESFSYAISNRFLPSDLRLYASFGSKGIYDHPVKIELNEQDLGKAIKADERAALEAAQRAALKGYVKGLREEAEKDKQKNNFDEAADKEAKASGLERAIEVGVFTSVRGTGRPSLAGIAQDQDTYGNPRLADAQFLEINEQVANASRNVEKGKEGEEIVSYKLTLEQAKETLPFLYNAVVSPDGQKTKDSQKNLDILVNLFSKEGGVSLYSPDVIRLDHTTVDQFGRLQNTDYYGSEFNGNSWQTVKLDKYTQHFYGPFGHQLSVTKDSTQIRPVTETVNKTAVVTPETTRTVVAQEAIDKTEIKMEDSSPLLKHDPREEASKKFMEGDGLVGIPQVEFRERVLNELNQMTPSARKEFFKDLDRVTQEVWNGDPKAHRYIRPDLKDMTLEDAHLLGMVLLSPKNEDGALAWNSKTPDEKVSLMRGLTGLRLALKPVYDRDGVLQSAKDLKTSPGDLAPYTTGYKQPLSSADQVDIKTVGTIYLPATQIKIPAKTKEEIVPAVTREESETMAIPARRQSSANYFYDLSLYSTGAGSSPYAGPKYQTRAHEVNSDLAMEAKGIKKTQGVSVDEYHKFIGRSSSGISAFSDQIALPKWSLDTEFGFGGSLFSDARKNYYYDAGKIKAEVDRLVKAKMENLSNNIEENDPDDPAAQEVRRLETVKLLGIEDIVGNKFFFVTGNMEDPDYYNAFYKMDNEFYGENGPATNEELSRLHEFDWAETEKNLNPDKRIWAEIEERYNPPLEIEVRKKKENIEDIRSRSDPDLLLKTSIGSDPVFLKSDFKKEAVQPR
jgi:hypothetical protein